MTRCSLLIFISRLSSALVSQFMLDLQEAHQKKVVDLANHHGTISWNFSLSSINFDQALGSLAAHVDGSNLDIPGVDWDEPQEGDEGGAPQLDEIISPGLTRPTEGRV